MLLVGACLKNLAQNIKLKTDMELNLLEKKDEKNRVLYFYSTSE